MALTENPKYVKEPNDLQCGQAVLAMLTDKTVDEIIELCQTDRETKLIDMFNVLDRLEITYDKTRKQVFSKTQLPDICVLSLETPRCWHWSLYYKGTFYDPEHGIMNDFPKSNRKYYWEIKR